MTSMTMMENIKIASLFRNHCQEDWVEIYNVYRSESTNDEWQRLNGRYCGQAAPGPIESEMEAVGLRVVLRTDTEHVHSGFQAIYQFKKKDMLFRGERKRNSF